MLTAWPRPRAASAASRSAPTTISAKPFEPRELLLRISNILKRTAQRPAAAREEVRFGDFTFNLARGELQRAARAGPPHRARARHAAMLAAAGPARRWRAWRWPATAGGANERTVDVQINRLRRKIEGDPAVPSICRRCAASATPSISTSEEQARARLQKSRPPLGTGRSTAASTTSPLSSGKPTTSTSDRNLPI